jgi:hypothetical protein
MYDAVTLVTVSQHKTNSPEDDNVDVETFNN